MHIKNNHISKTIFEKIRTQEKYTAGDIITGEIYSTNIALLNATFPIEFIFASISDELLFQFLIGRNLLDELDAFFLEKSKIFY